MTDNEIKQAIETCHWKQNTDGIPICKGMVLPCERVIDRGQCEVLIEYFKKKKQDEITEHYKKLGEYYNGKDV